MGSRPNTIIFFFRAALGVVDNGKRHSSDASPPNSVSSQNDSPSQTLVCQEDTANITAAAINLPVRAYGIQITPTTFFASNYPAMQQQYQLASFSFCLVTSTETQGVVVNTLAIDVIFVWWVTLLFCHLFNHALCLELSCHTGVVSAVSFIFFCNKHWDMAL